MSIIKKPSIFSSSITRPESFSTKEFSTLNRLPFMKWLRTHSPTLCTFANSEGLLKCWKCWKWQIATPLLGSSRGVANGFQDGCTYTYQTFHLSLSNLYTILLFSFSFLDLFIRHAFNLFDNPKSNSCIIYVSHLFTVYTSRLFNIYVLYLFSDHLSHSISVFVSAMQLKVSLPFFSPCNISIFRHPSQNTQL